MTITVSIFILIGIFVMAGLLEIGGGYLIWTWLREGDALYLGLLGVIGLGLYGVVITFQPFHFGRAYAAYGGIFIVMSLFWSWLIDKKPADVYDWIGAGICVVGVMIMLLGPRD